MRTSHHAQRPVPEHRLTRMRCWLYACVVVSLVGGAVTVLAAPSAEARNTDAAARVCEFELDAS